MIFKVPTTGRLDDGARRMCAGTIRQYAGKQVEITVQEYDKSRRKRTLQQNKYWHAEPFFKLATHWGCSVQTAKLDVMGEFWGWEKSPNSGHYYPVKAHTSDMTVEEGTTFLDWLIPWALDEHGVAIDLPEQWEQRTAA